MRTSSRASLLAAAMLIACSSDDTTSSAAPVGPPVIAIDAFHPAGGPSVDTASGTLSAGACVELGRDAAGSVAVHVAVKNWDFRAPEGCGATAQCGLWALEVSSADGGPTTRLVGAGPTITLPAATLRSPAGPHTFRAELLQDDGSPATLVHGEDGAVTSVTSTSIVVTLAAHCGGETDGGAPDGGADAMAPDGAADAATGVPSDAALDAAADGADGGAGSAADGGARDAGDATLPGTLDAAADVAAPEAAVPDAATGDASGGPGTPDAGIADAATSG